MSHAILCFYGAICFLQYLDLGGPQDFRRHTPEDAAKDFEKYLVRIGISTPFLFWFWKAGMLPTIIALVLLFVVIIDDREVFSRVHLLRRLEADRAYLFLNDCLKLVPYTILHAIIIEVLL